MRERESDIFYLNDCGGPDDQIIEIETPRPEYPGQLAKYPGVTQYQISNFKFRD